MKTSGTFAADSKWRALLLVLLLLLGLAAACSGDAAPSRATATAAASAPAATATPPPSLTPVEAYLRDIAGTWSATLIEFAEALPPYPVTLVIETGRVRVDYPTYSCGGSLTPDRLDPDGLYLIERIEYGPAGGCFNGGIIRLQKSGTNLLWDWYYDDGSEAMEQATMTKR